LRPEFLLSKISLFLLCFSICSAADWSTIYDCSKLQAEKPRLQKAMDFLVQKEILPFIPEQEATAFGLLTIDLPPTDFRTDPLDFYSEEGHIILPVRTLLFLEDLSRAYGWMWGNRFSTKTADEYLMMLRYRNPADFQDGKFPPPLIALHVPENALSDPKVVAASLLLRRTAYAFILLHEFAHLQLHHQISSRHSYSEPQEEAADLFALNIMKENSATPTGLLVVMRSALLFEAGTEESLHPVTSARLDGMAKYLDRRVTDFVRGRQDRPAAMDAIQSIASLLTEGAEWLSVPGHQAESQQLALRTGPATLFPRPLPATTR
jgi:hypothetical protein